MFLSVEHVMKLLSFLTSTYNIISSCAFSITCITLRWISKIFIDWSKETEIIFPEGNIDIVEFQAYMYIQQQNKGGIHFHKINSYN